MSHCRRLLMLVTVLTLVTPSLAFAQSFYAGGRGGISWTSDTRQGPPGREDVFEFKTGLSGGAALGYRLPLGLRAEGEVGYIYAPVKRDGGVEIDGSTKTWLLMANLYYDLALPFLGPFKPYVGFGLGGARVNEDHEIFVNSLGVKTEVDDWRTAFAYQARVGVTYELSQLWDVSAGYRFVRVNGSTPTLHDQKIHFDGMNNHSIEVGFAIKF